MTRSVPLPTAVVNGESPFSNARAYGSSDVSVKRSVRSASCFVSEIDAPRAGHRQTRRRRLELDRHGLAAHVEPARDLADAFVGDEQVADAAAKLVARHVERAGAVRVEFQQARQRRLRIRSSP